VLTDGQGPRSGVTGQAPSGRRLTIGSPLRWCTEVYATRSAFLDVFRASHHASRASQQALRARRRSLSRDSGRGRRAAANSVRDTRPVPRSTRRGTRERALAAPDLGTASRESWIGPRPASCSPPKRASRPAKPTKASAPDITRPAGANEGIPQSRERSAKPSRRLQTHARRPQTSMRRPQDNTRSPQPFTRGPDESQRPRQARERPLPIRSRRPRRPARCSRLPCFFKPFAPRGQPRTEDRRPRTDD
jgi:hypothetical protein